MFAHGMGPLSRAPILPSDVRERRRAMDEGKVSGRVFYKIGAHARVVRRSLDRVVVTARELGSVLAPSKRGEVVSSVN